MQKHQSALKEEKREREKLAKKLAKEKVKTEKVRERCAPRGSVVCVPLPTTMLSPPGNPQGVCRGGGGYSFCGG